MKNLKIIGGAVAGALVIVGAVFLMASKKGSPEIGAIDSLQVPPQQLSTQTYTVNDGGEPMTPENSPLNFDVKEIVVKSKFGMIRSIKQAGDGSISIVFDEAEFLSGDQANRAAMEDNGCFKPNPPDLCTIPNGLTPNDFYIHNNDKSVKQYQALTNPKIRLISMGNLDFGVGIKGGTIVDIKKILDADKTLPGYDGTPFWLTFDNGNVIAIEQQYIP